MRARSWTVLEDAARGDDMAYSKFPAGAAEADLMRWRFNTLGTVMIAAFDVDPELVPRVASLAENDGSNLQGNLSGRQDGFVQKLWSNLSTACHHPG